MSPAAEASEAVLQSIHAELTKQARRLARLEEAAAPGAAQPQPQAQPLRRKYDPRDPLGPVFDALESINGELTGFAERLDRIEASGHRVTPRPRFPLLRARPGTSAAAIRAARGRRARKAVPRA
ncbi:hypothetical protein [Streptomyces sp. NPDC002215]|uniref:hypothetical protein n=1 Tax=Streptomyces sp. NPDC002215 TaxID=3154412 RepID=UPI00332ED711